jgi:predicted RNA-binding Zn-ribbon protein involved in translation (DUF1610 family)
LLDRDTGDLIRGHIALADLSAELMWIDRERGLDVTSPVQKVVAQSCPSCGTQRIGFFRFCRTCGLDYEADHPSSDWQLPSDSAAPRDAGSGPEPPLEYCPSCGTHRIAFFAFCPTCGLDYRAIWSGSVDWGPPSPSSLGGTAWGHVAPSESLDNAPIHAATIAVSSATESAHATRRRFASPPEIALGVIAGTVLGVIAIIMGARA